MNPNTPIPKITPAGHPSIGTPRHTSPRIDTPRSTNATPKVSTERPRIGNDVPDFQTFLQDRLRVSGHASTRLASRKLELGQQEWDRVMGGIDKAAAKGARESLVMCDEVALVVSVKNRTVITALDKAQLKDNVFTNIDSAVIV